MAMLFVSGTAFLRSCDFFAVISFSRRYSRLSWIVKIELRLLLQWDFLQFTWPSRYLSLAQWRLHFVAMKTNFLLCSQHA